jgi:aspartate-semialdehyde dehydrogenase
MENTQESSLTMANTGNKTLAVVGATGVVGQTMARVLEERRFPVGEYVPIATELSAHKKVEAFGENWLVRDARAVDFRGIDFCLFTAGAAVSGELVPKAIDAGCRVVDNTTAFRMEKDVPLVVPEINGSLVTRETKLVSCPNCTAIVLVMTLAPIERAVPIERVVVTSFQSVSGAGREALDELNDQTAADTRGGSLEVNALPKQIAFNCLPQIGDVGQSGYTKEEEKIIEETQKILDRPDIRVVATAVRVPTRVGHAMSVNVELRSPLDVDKARELWTRAKGVTYTDEIPTPLDVTGRDDVIVGRLRRDTTRPYAITYWAVGDNLRKGAATNSVQIAELMLLSD